MSQTTSKRWLSSSFGAAAVRASGLAMVVASSCLAAACSGNEGTGPSDDEPFAVQSTAALTAAPTTTSGEAVQPSGGEADRVQTGPTTIDTPIGLAFEIEDGAAKPLRVRAGQTFYINQIDMRAEITSSVDEGVSGLESAGDFHDLEWCGVSQADQEFVLSQNPDGTFTRRRFFRHARWMDRASRFTVEQIDAAGHAVAEPVTVRTGVEDQRRTSDDFFDRRFRAIQWTYDCASTTDCSGAQSFQEEALVELRYAMHPEQTFRIRRSTAALRVTWSLRPHSPYVVPVTQVAAPEFDYGFNIDVAPITPSRADGTYPPGTDVEFQITLRDGAGRALHAPDSLPTYNDVVFGENEPGIQYYRAFFDPTTTYYRRKHRERMLMSQIVGPMQDAQPIRRIAELSTFLDPTRDVQDTGTLEGDGFFAEFRTFPTSHDLFGGAFDPSHAGWAAPVPNRWKYHIPANAPSGTYKVTTKGRRVYLGQDIPATKTIELQIGTTKKTSADLNTGPCNTCHSGQSSLTNILHANADRSACAGCHVPLGFEYEGPIYVRTHFIHSRSARYGAPKDRCAQCHLDTAGIQRTSKSACLSCHSSYPKSHVQRFGPITSMYVGGGRESFQQCTSTCHTTHPDSGL